MGRVWDVVSRRCKGCKAFPEACSLQGEAETVITSKLLGVGPAAFGPVKPEVLRSQTRLLCKKSGSYKWNYKWGNYTILRS